MPPFYNKLLQMNKSDQDMVWSERLWFGDQSIFLTAASLPQNFDLLYVALLYEPQVSYN